MNKISLLASLLAFSACVVDSTPESDQGTSSPDITEVAKLAGNGMMPADLASLNISSVRLTTTTAATQASTLAGRRVLTNLVSCALAPGDSFAITVSGTVYTYPGAIGSAMLWKHGPMTTAEAQAVSACLYARVNLDGKNVTLSLRGQNAGFSTTSGELSGYEVEEGAFWGNAFSNQGTVVGYACNGVDQLVDDTYTTLPDRECAEDDGTGVTYCGYQYAGACASVCSTVNGYYYDCAQSGEPTFGDVGTSFLYGAPL